MAVCEWPGQPPRSRFVAKPDEIWELEAYIKDLNGGRVVINASGEMFCQDYPTVEAVANFCNSGGIYVDYCGWPMFYDKYGNENPGQFRRFLSLIGADPNYCLGFMPPTYIYVPFDGWYLYERGIGRLPCDPFTKGYPYPRSWISPVWIGPEDRNAVIYPLWSTPTNACSATGYGEPQLYIYSVVSVKAIKGSKMGWYFYAFGQLDGESVNPQTLSGFIGQLVSEFQGGVPGGGEVGGGGGGGRVVTIPGEGTGPNYTLYAIAIGGTIIIATGIYLTARGIRS